MWACGEKMNPTDDDVTSTDITVGWLTLAVSHALGNVAGSS